MVNLFHINHYQINTSKFSNLLHDHIVQEFEHKFAEYVGAKYACSANSASSLLFLALCKLNTTVRIPSTIPIVVPNVVINAGNKVEFYDDVDWVGKAYTLHNNIIDSAQEVTKNQYRDIDNPDTIMIFSFYPTKPVGGCDGGMVVSNSEDTINWFKTMTLNGTSFSANNWDRKHVAAGYKMHATSIQAYIANENLKKLDKKNERLDEISAMYNQYLHYTNDSRHLYRIRVKDNKQFIKQMKQNGITCGIHYTHCHDKPFYGWTGELPQSMSESTNTVSIPFHEQLSDTEVKHILNTIDKIVRKIKSC
tara:strand:+ start:1279 stop:2199 length:921 start_codon:yes stop_codon:yes gene_type:complete